MADEGSALTALGLFLLPAALALIVSWGRLEIALLASIGLGQWLAGSWITRDLHSELFAVCLAGTVFFFAGYALGRRRTQPRARTSTSVLRAGLPALSLLTVALVVVHFARGGVPILSSNVETARFELAGSGLLGIPSRAYLFGLPILVLALSSLPDRNRRERQIMVLVITAFVVSRILGGLKSGLLEVMFVVLIALCLLTGGRIRIVSAPVMKRALVGVVAVVFAGYLSTQYATVHTNSVSSAGSYLVKRISTGTVSAGGYVVAGTNLHRGGPYLLTDFAYYTNKYSAGVPAGLGVPVPQDSLSRLVSTGLVGLPATTSAYASPVALGLAPSLFLDFGWAGVIVGMALAGYALRRVQWRAVDSSGFAAGAWGGACLVGMYIVVNGGLAYYTINYAATAALYFIAVVAFARADGVAARTAVRNQLNLQGAGDRP